MKRLVAFDLDGTLAESKQALEPDMAGLLADLAGHVAVAVISGIGALMGRQLAELANDLPFYQATVSQKLNGLFGGEGPSAAPRRCCVRWARG